MQYYKILGYLGISRIITGNEIFEKNLNIEEFYMDLRKKILTVVEMLPVCSLKFAYFCCPLLI